MDNIKKFLKEKWQIVASFLLLLIGFLSMKKTQDKTKEKDLGTRLDAAKNISEEKEKIQTRHDKKEDKILKEYKKELKDLSDEKRKIADELSNDPEKLRDYLKSLGIEKK